MSTSFGTLLFWFVAVGLITGLASYYAFRDQGISQVQSIGMGTLGSVVVGSLCLILNLSGALAFSFVGAVGFLFLTNAFRQDEESKSGSAVKIRS